MMCSAEYFHVSLHCSSSLFVTASVAWHTITNAINVMLPSHARTPTFEFCTFLYLFTPYKNIIFWYCNLAPLHFTHTLYIFSVYIPIYIHTYPTNLGQRNGDFLTSYFQKRKHMYPVRRIRGQAASRVAKSLGALGANCLNKWSANVY